MVKGRRILLVDDDENVLFVLRASLHRQDDSYEITTARDGRAALELAESSPFDLLITDVRLPGLDGVMLTEAMRAAVPWFGVIWITAYGCRELVEKMELLHVNACLEKPVEIAEFRDSVRRALMSSPPEA
jgi:DNA-binding NtrC family response regulator